MLHLAKSVQVGRQTQARTRCPAYGSGLDAFDTSSERRSREAFSDDEESSVKVTFSPTISPLFRLKSASVGADAGEREVSAAS